MARTTGKMPRDKMGNIREDDTGTLFGEVFLKLGAYVRQPGKLMPELDQLHDSIAAAERITIDETNERVIIEHVDGTEA